jgi:dihydrofolate reductase
MAETIDQAQAAAGGKQVHVMGGADLIRQALAAGLVANAPGLVASPT